MVESVSRSSLDISPIEKSNRCQVFIEFSCACFKSILQNLIEGLTCNLRRAFFRVLEIFLGFFFVYGIVSTQCSTFLVY